MKILVINCGSSSIKYQALDMTDESVMAIGLAERIGEPRGRLTHKKFPNRKEELEKIIESPIPDHTVGMNIIVDLLTDREVGVIEEASEISAVGHRVVHGGERFRAPALIDDQVIQAIEETIPLAPLHNPANLAGIKVAQKLISRAPQVAVFDTAFHQTMAPHVYLYSLPYEYYEELGIRRYGFHGTSHSYVAREAARLMGRPLEELNLMTIHLGSGASTCAIAKGKSVDTSMGMTPVAGIIMGTRSGNVDPGIIFYLAQQKGMSIGELERILTHESGLKGICGLNDMRDIHARAAEGDQRAQLALDMFVYRIKKYIGNYFAVLGYLDGLVFTAGIGEHDVEIRRRCCENLQRLGIILDLEKNRARSEGPLKISTAESAVQVFVIATNEELEIARQTREALAAEGLV
ncbi:MAG: acetate kinase [Deltaproteobacteria bacterium]|nr:acetate kinase [Deltaproteobacteria bacterium]